MSILPTLTLVATWAKALLKEKTPTAKITHAATL
jgi:hypothetical protein